MTTGMIALYVAIGLAIGIAISLLGSRLASQHRLNAFILAATCVVAWPGAVIVALAVLHPGLRARIERYLEGRP